MFHGTLHCNFMYNPRLCSMALHIVTLCTILDYVPWHFTLSLCVRSLMISTYICIYFISRQVRDAAGDDLQEAACTGVRQVRDASGDDLQEAECTGVLQVRDASGDDLQEAACTAVRQVNKCSCACFITHE